MKILVYGSNGWIGNQFIDVLKSKNQNYFIGKARAENPLALEKELHEIKPTHVVSFIGRTHGKIGDKTFTTIDYLEEEGKLVENIRDNLFSPIVLAELCRNRHIHYTYLGTGCIFKFDDEHPFGLEESGFDEDSLPNFFGSSYSVVKGFTDQIMHLGGYKNSVLNLRIRMPITGNKNPRNFITKISTYDRICSIPNSMTVLPELLPFVLTMMERKQCGTVNLTNPGLVSHNEILTMYKEIVDPLFTWKNFSQEEQRKILTSDRSNNFLETHKLESLFPEVLNIKDSIRNCLIEYRKELDAERKPVNLLVTGGCGFIGSNFINYYFPLGKLDSLVNLDALYYCADIDNVDEYIQKDKGYVFLKANLCDADYLDTMLKKYQITHVIHFAAQSHVQNSFEDSLTFTHDNVLGTHTLLESCRKYKKIVKFIHVSTDEVYGESMNDIHEKHKTEHSILCPTNPYAATKAGAELIAQSYNHSYNMPIIITRGNNVYGPNQYPEKLIPRFIKLLNEGKKVTIQGEGKTVRAFLHAYDTATAFEAILEQGTVGEIYNIGCDEGMEYSVMEIAKILIKLIKNTEDYEEWIEYVEDRPYNDMRYYISNKKVRELGWNIKVDLMTGLNDLINRQFKIKLLELKKMESISDVEKRSYFGDWINNSGELFKQFNDAEPFDHIIIPNFLNEEYANLICDKFPTDVTSKKWHKYNNPLEIKYANDDINNLPVCIRKLFYLLSTDEIINEVSALSGIESLEYDPYLHGAGLHIHPRNGKLNMHLDYEKHPHMEKERRLNIILYMSKDWKEEWNGDTQLWDKDMQNCVVRSHVKFNTAIIFKTNNQSWHGLPETIKCPENVLRKSIAYYYISPLVSDSDENVIGNDGSGFRKKATYCKRPCDSYDENMEKLFKIRSRRLISNDDLQDLFPGFLNKM